MRRLEVMLVSILALSMGVGVIGCGIRRSSDSFDNALVILESVDRESMQESIEYIGDRGGRITHIYPTHILIGLIPKDISQELVGEAGIIAIHYGLVDPSTVEEYGKTAVYAVEAWNNNFMGQALKKGLTPKPGEPEPEPIMGDALIVPETEEPVRRGE